MIGLYYISIYIEDAWQPLTDGNLAVSTFESASEAQLAIDELRQQEVFTMAQFRTQKFAGMGG